MLQEGKRGSVLLWCDTLGFTKNPIYFQVEVVTLLVCKGRKSSAKQSKKILPEGKTLREALIM